MAGFLLECVAGFVGIRNRDQMERATVLFRIEGPRQGACPVADKREGDWRGDESSKFGGGVMTLAMPKSQRCAIYTRVLRRDNQDESPATIRMRAPFWPL